METPRPPPSESMRFRVRLRTRWSDEDNQRVLNNAVYLTLLEEARFAYFSGLKLLSENQFPFLLAQTNVLFVTPGIGGAEVDVEVSTVHLGEKSFTQAYRVIAVADRAVWCEAEARLVAWDNAKRASVPMSREFRERVRAFEAR